MSTTQINIKNVNPHDWHELVTRFPASPSLIMRALISHALTLSDADYLKIINQQAARENKEKGLK